MIALRAIALAAAACALSCGPETKPAPIAPEPASAAPAPSDSASPQGRRLPADTPVEMTSGASFTAPEDWTLTSEPGLVTLVEPEGELTLWLVEVPGAGAAEAAIETAWKRARPEFDEQVERTASPPATDGWDAVTQVSYAIPEAEKRAAVAIALLDGEVWHVVLLDGALAALDRRGAQVNLAISSLEPATGGEESFAGKEANPLSSERLAELTEFVESAREQLEIPGVAVAVVQGGKLIYERGFGVRRAGDDAKVSPRTMFMIGSTTKSLTSLLMAKLVDEGKLSWDTPVTDVLPWFALGDPEATRKLTVQHTVCACTGLPRQDMEFLFEYRGRTARERLEAMKEMKPTTGFGEVFQYSNPLVAAGGFVAGHAAEPKQEKLSAAYRRALARHILEPLGMKSTTLDMERARRGEHAAPHGRTLELRTVALPISAEEAVVSVGPAGGAWSSARDLARYVTLELGRGVAPSGERLVSEENLLHRREPQVRISADGAYGLGLFVGEESGVPIAGHGGNTLGFTSDVFFLPEHGVGVVLLTNAGGANGFRNAFRRKVFELLFDGRDEAGPGLAFHVEQRKKDSARELAKIEKQPDPGWVASFAGRYRNPALGELHIRAKSRILDAGEWRSKIGKYTDADGSAKIILLDPPLAGLTFDIESKDGQSLIVLQPPQQRYVFAPAR